MKRSIFFTFLCASFITFILPGCQAIGDVFKAGVWSGIIIVVLIVALILYLINRGSKKS